MTQEEKRLKIEYLYGLANLADLAAGGRHSEIGKSLREQAKEIERTVGAHRTTSKLERDWNRSKKVED